MARIRNWCVCSGHASVPEAYAQQTHQFLTLMIRVCINSWFVCSAWCEGTALCALISTQCTHRFLFSEHISSWHKCSAYAFVPDAHARCMHKFLTPMLSVYKMNIWKMGKLLHMLNMPVGKWCIWPGCASVPDTHAIDTKKWSQKLHEKFFFAQTQIYCPSNLTEHTRKEFSSPKWNP